MRQEVWIKHDTRSRTDPKMAYFINKHGMEGYGIFWALIEILHYQNNHEFDLEIEFRGVAAQLFYDEERLQNIIETLLETGLFKCEDGKVFQARLKQAEAERSKKKSASFASKSAAGKIGGIISGLKRSGASPEEIQLFRSRIEANASTLKSSEANEAEEIDKKEKKEEKRKQKEASTKQNTLTHASENFETKTSDQNLEPHHSNATAAQINDEAIPSSQTKGGDKKTLETKASDLSEDFSDLKFGNQISSLLEAPNFENPESWQNSNEFIVAGRRPLKKYPKIFISPVELSRVLESFDKKLPREFWPEVFQAAEAKLITQELNGRGMKNTSVFNWLTGFLLKDKIDELASLGKLKRYTEK